ncbi:MAG: hypothetical protein ACRDPT_01310 [Streptomycetales bacterium]
MLAVLILAVFLMIAFAVYGLTRPDEEQRWHRAIEAMQRVTTAPQPPEPKTSHRRLRAILRRQRGIREGSGRRAVRGAE